MQDGPWRGATRAAARRRPAGRPGRASTGRKRRGAACAWGASLSAMGGDDRGDGVRRRRARPRAGAAGRDVDAVAGRRGKGERGPVRRRPAHTACHYIRHGRAISFFRHVPAGGAALVKGGGICYNIVKTAVWRGGRAKAMRRDGHPCIGRFDNFGMASSF